MAQPKTPVILQIRPAKDSEIKPSSFVNFLGSLKNSLKTSFFDQLFGRQDTLSLELISLNQSVYFIIACAPHLEQLVKSQISANYPNAIITQMSDYLPTWINHGQSSIGRLVLSKPSFLPIKTVSDSEDDQLSSVLSVLSRFSPGQAAIIQINIFSVSSSWVNYCRKLITPKQNADGTTIPAHPQKALIEQKMSYPGYGTDIRIVAIGPTSAISASILSQIGSSFGVFSLSEGNSFSLKTLKASSQMKLKQSILNRDVRYASTDQILNYLEIASIFHLPNIQLSTIKNIAWGKTIKGEAPEGLPIAEGLNLEDQGKITFYGKTEYKNRLISYGIQLPDRRRHFYILGKSGTGKSTLIANMAIADMHNGRGLAVVDPHGDLCEILLDYVPSDRIDDVIYLDPSDINFPFHINPLEIDKPEHKELVVSNILSIFTKIWANVWSARMEYILRNSLVTLAEIPGSTMLDIPNLLTDDNFRANLLKQIDPDTNRVILDFWNREYNQYNDKFRSEAIAPILNKVGQFISGPTIRRILQQPKSTINVEDIMNSGKILLLNLSQGKVGEDNAALLGAMFITQFQQAAMNRINTPEDDRKDFFLYVDEFQNFATSSFIKILSEARKYRLDLILANQYTAQLPDEIQKAIFGNVGTMISFVVGADDANRIMMEFGNLYTQDDLVNLGKYQIINKLSIDNRISNPFPAYTLPIPKELKNDNRQKVLNESRQNFLSKEPVSQTTPIQEKFQQSIQNPVNYNHGPKPSNRLQSSNFTPSIESNRTNSNNRGQSSYHPTQPQSYHSALPSPRNIPAVPGRSSQQGNSHRYNPSPQGSRNTYSNSLPVRPPRNSSFSHNQSANRDNNRSGPQSSSNSNPDNLPSQPSAWN